MDAEEGTTKYAKAAKREAKLLFKGESYKLSSNDGKMFHVKRYGLTSKNG